MYYDAKNSIFYIDTAGTGGETGTRQKINAWGAVKAVKDQRDQIIDDTYIKGISITDGKLSATLGNTVGLYDYSIVTGVKGSEESTYRFGDVNITRANIGLGNAKIFSGTCSTAAATAEKGVVCGEFTSEELVIGSSIKVTFSITNSAAVANLKLNVNSTGAKPIKYMYNAGVSNLPDKGYLVANQTYIFHYDGTNWVIDNIHYNTNSDTQQRTFRSNTNIELPIAGISTANSQTAAYAAISSGSYKAVYAAIPEDTTKLVTLNPSTGRVTAPEFNGKLSHSITFGNNGTFVFDGTADVVVPTYDGSYDLSS